jgi:hypothetical protein
MSGATTKRLVLVVGVGRSGTSLLTGILGQLGCHIPTPEVKADDTNPRGFGEPRWVVDFHTALLRERRVTVNDARPAAFERMAEGPEIEAGYAQLREWLSSQLAQADTVVVKDPRTVWFLPLWTRCAEDLGVATSFVTMLRHPAEILASATKSYGTWQSASSRAAAWLNVTLETEHATRGAHRAFVRYEDLLADWAAQVRRVGEAIESPKLAAVDRNPDVDAFVDPGLHRNRIGWEELEVPASVRDLAEEVWARLQPLARGEDAQLEEVHAAYGALYAEAEAIAQSTITAAKPRKKPAKAKAPAPPPSLGKRLRRRAAGALRRS